LIASGDIVVGDEDGVVAFPQAIAAALVEADPRKCVKRR
jgi:regulator of RNase E activity RraA